MENLYTPDCIRTYTGIYMNVFEPTIDMICIEDIAHALSNLCRFGGHTPEFYSVAQHSFLCASITPPHLKLEALLHDASEAYLMDIPSPIKSKLSNYRDIEHRLMLLISEKFQFEYPISRSVKIVDKEVLELEWKQLVLKEPLVENFVCWTPGYSKRRFLETFTEITGQATGTNGQSEICQRKQ